MIARPLHSILLAGALSLVLVACGGGGDHFGQPPAAAPEVPVTPPTPPTPSAPPIPPTPETPETPPKPDTPQPPAPVVLDGQAVIGDAGGSVTIQDATSPIFGAQVSVPANSMPNGSETITIAYQDQLPGPLPAEAVALGAARIGKVLVLSRAGNADFVQPVAVRAPFDKASLAPDAIPVAVGWDDTLQAYAPATLVSVDRDKGFATFMTAHFSRFALFVLNRYFGAMPPGPLELSVDVGFVASTDGFYIRNFGDSGYPLLHRELNQTRRGINGFAMAAYSAWYYRWIKPGAAGLATLYREGAPVLEDDDLVARELVSRAYVLALQKNQLQSLAWLNNGAFGTRQRADRFTGFSILSQLVITRQPQVLALGTSGASGWGDTHAVAVHGYDATTKRFRLYDSNVPGQVRELNWDPDTGFGPYFIDEGGNLVDAFAFASPDQAYSAATLRQLYDGAQAGWPASTFGRIGIASPTELPPPLSGTYEVPSADNVTVTGTATRPASAQNPGAQRYVHVFLNGAPAGTAVPVGNADDAFSIPIAKLPKPLATEVMLVVSDSATSWGTAPAFKQFKLRAAGQSVFRNLGFETGDFTSWASERTRWPNRPPVPPVVPSDKNAILVAGAVDAIATDVPVVLFGRYSARVNDPAGGRDVSMITQAAVVPNTSNPVVRFHWAAVLQNRENGTAPAEAQDRMGRVEIMIVNETKRTIVFQQGMLADGWLSLPASSRTETRWYGGQRWTWLPWQLVELSVADCIGDTLRLTVEARDSDARILGSYGYIDAEE